MKAFTIKLCSALPGLGICFIFLLFGEFFKQTVKTDIPGVIWGMLSFLGFLAIYQLYFQKIPLFIKRTSDFFLPLLPLFILPSCIGILAHLDLLHNEALKITIAIFIGMILTQILTPYVFIWSLKLFKRKRS